MLACGLHGCAEMLRLFCGCSWYHGQIWVSFPMQGRRKARTNLFTTSLPCLLELLFIAPMPRKAAGPLFICTVWCVWFLIICFPKYPSLVLTVLLQKGQYFFSEIQYSSSYRCPVLCHERLSERASFVRLNLKVEICFLFLFSPFWEIVW